MSIKLTIMATGALCFPSPNLKSAKISSKAEIPCWVQVWQYRTKAPESLFDTHHTLPNYCLTDQIFSMESFWLVCSIQDITIAQQSLKFATDPTAARLHKVGRF